MQCDFNIHIEDVSELLTLIDALRDRPLVVEKIVEDRREQEAPTAQEEPLEDIIEQTVEQTAEQRQPRTQRVLIPQQANGRYCVECGKSLTGGQRIFCSQGHAGKWTTQHRGEKARPRFSPPVTTVVAGEGILAPR